MLPTHVVEVEVPAKINLGLLIGERMPDGFHTIDTVYQSISLLETIRIYPASSIKGAPPDKGYLASDGFWMNFDTAWEVPLDETNLVARAARRMAETARKPLGEIGIQVIKRTPIGAGLGGGSADAAGVLLGLNTLWKTPLSKENLLEIASELGSDVPFCLQGGTARGLGRGNKLTQISNKLDFWIVLVKANIDVGTSNAYASFDQLGFVQKKDLTQLVEALENGQPQKFLNTMKNDFEVVIDLLYPKVTSVTCELVAAGCPRALLAGSGASVWGICWDQKQADQVASVLDARYPFVRVVRPLAHGPRIRSWQ